MSYQSVVEMSESPGLRRRLIGAAAQEGRADAATWVDQNVFALVKGTDWEDAWDYAEDTKTVNVNPDSGARDDVINDAMILSSVQALISAQSQ